jgi:probable F420-dependent oxidoreductase
LVCRYGQQVTNAIRFGVVSESVLDGPAWADQARRIEESGINSLLIRDHFSASAFGQQLAPFSALAAAAAVTTRLTVGTLVLSNDFRHPALVAHEAATLHHLSGGRFELGIGAGWYEPEYQAAGITFGAARERIDRLEESLTIMKDLLAGNAVHHSGRWYQIDGLDLDVLPGPRDVPRLLVGAGGPRMLRLAARHADIVGLLPSPITGTEDQDDAAGRLPAALDQKLHLLQSVAGDRFAKLELSAFATFSVAANRRSATEALIAERRWRGIDCETVWQMPTIFIGSVPQIREDLYARRERFGLSYFVSPDRDLPTIAEIVGSM